MGKITTDKRAGFTLMELMVYIAIVGIVVIVAGQAFSNSTKMRVRTQSMLKASEVAENVATLFKTDVAQMGAKSSMESRGAAGSDDVFSGVRRDVYIDPDNEETDQKDSSSFQFVPATPTANTNLEQFKMRRVRYSESGTYEAVEEITWLLENKVLKRRCIVLDNGTAGDDCAPKGTTGDALDQYTTEMATDVDSFKVLPAIPDGTVGDLQIFPAAAGGSIRMISRTGLGNLLPVVAGTGGTSVQLTGFASNYVEGSDEIPSIKKTNEVYVFENSDVTGTWKSLCENVSVNHFTFEPGQEYKLSFGSSTPITATEKAKMFVPGKDHMAVGFRNADGDKFDQLPDFLFYPPTILEMNTVKRTMRFTVPETIENACLAFTFSFFSPLAANGTIVISDLKLEKVASATYNFDPATTSVAIVDKKNVKAFQLRLSVKRNGESGEATLVIPTPSNGPTD
jgi:prepilin-type N-terminal cleavage/methylation domain-containing protein